VNRLRRLGRLALDAVLPPLCLACNAIVGEPGSLCPHCWNKITFLSAPLCRACGHPFEVEAGAESICGRCLADPPPWNRARAVFAYDSHSKALVLRFKHADRLEGVPTFAAWMARAGAELVTQADLVTAVPLHRWRLLSRRYNQAALLANALGRRSGKPAYPALLARTRSTPVQGHLDRGQRGRNVKGAFRLTPGGQRAVAGRNVLLVDDVRTTGATAAECVRTLLAAGAASVDVLTLGLVVLPQA
jgi:ComF family protein